jgi:hypothetical protein
MSTRDRAPLGSPCWADLWTSDVDGSRGFYSEVFGWEAQEADPQFGGYFMFTRDGVPVADLGNQAVFIDPTGADLGAWEPGTFPGFTVLGEHGSPSWFELFTRDYAAALDFYRTVFHWDLEAVGDSDQFRYSVLKNPDAEGELAGIMDAGAFLPEGMPAHWSVYWEVDDPAATIATITTLGGSVVADLEETPYGRMATVSDPAGAQFKLRAAPK